MMIHENCGVFFQVLNFGDKCDVCTDKKKNITDTRLFCVSVGVGERLSVFLCEHNEGWYCSSARNTCNPAKALNTVTVYSKGSL